MAFASRAAFRAIPSSWRCYSSGSHNKTTPHYLSFKKGVSNVRVKFIEELKLEKKMMMEDSNSQTAQEARKESEREALALEENEKELQRMAEKRLINEIIRIAMLKSFIPPSCVFHPGRKEWLGCC